MLNMKLHPAAISLTCRREKRAKPFLGQEQWLTGGLFPANLMMTIKLQEVIAPG